MIILLLLINDCLNELLCRLDVVNMTSGDDYWSSSYDPSDLLLTEHSPTDYSGKFDRADNDIDDDETGIVHPSMVVLIVVVFATLISIIVIWQRWRYHFCSWNSSNYIQFNYIFINFITKIIRFNYNN